MKKNINMGIDQISFYVLLLLFPILPQYIYIVGGINLVNFLVMIYLISAIFSWKLVKIGFFKCLPFFWIYEMVITILCLIDGGVLEGIAYFLSFFVIPYLLIGYINTREKFFKAIDILILGGLLLGLFGIFEQIIKFNVFQSFANGELQFESSDMRYGLLRVMTTFGQPIAYGLYQVFISAIVYYRMNTGITKRQKRFLIAVYVISVINILFSVSRTPILAYLLIQILLIYQRSKKKFVNVLFFSATILIVGGMIGEVLGLKIPLIDDIIQTVFSLFQGVTRTSEQTVGIGDRLSLWSWVAESMSGKWIFGNGATAEFAYQVYDWQTKTSIENHYLYTLFHYGLVGFSSLILMYISVLIYTKKKNKYFSTKFDEVKLSFNKCLFIVFLLYNFVELSVQETDLSRLYVVLIALLISYNRIVRKNSISTTGGC